MVNVSRLFMLNRLPIAKKFALPGCVYLVGILLVAFSVYLFINDLRTRNNLIYDVIIQENILSKLERDIAEVNEGLIQMLFFNSREFDVTLLAKAEDFQSSLVEFRQLAHRHNLINDESIAEEIEPVLELMRIKLIDIVALSFSGGLERAPHSYHAEFNVFTNQIREFNNEAMYGKSEFVESLLEKNNQRKLLFSILFLVEVLITAMMSYGMYLLVFKQLIIPINKIKVISDEVVKHYAQSNDGTFPNDVEYEQSLAQLENIKSKDEVGDLAGKFLLMMQTIDKGRCIEAEKKSAIERLYIDIKQKNEQLVKTQVELSDRNAELQKVHKQLVRSNEQLEQSEKLSAIGEMSAGIAHEINQPLGVIRLYTDTIIYKLLGQSPEISDMLNKNLQQLDRISQIINHLKMFSREDNSDIHESISINWLIEQSMILIKPELKLHSIALNINIEGQEQSVLCNQVQLVQVFTNLINNAKDAIIEFSSTSAGKGKPKRISISVCNRNGRTLIQVQDTGGGIPEALTQKIFQPFYTTKPVGSGTGLGLSICYGIIEEHAGTLVCHSQEGEGSIFSIELPHVMGLIDEERLEYGKYQTMINS